MLKYHLEAKRSKPQEFCAVQELRNREGNWEAEEVCGGAGAGRTARSLPGSGAGAGDSRPSWEPGSDVG